jgi:hypothetical protein
MKTILNSLLAVIVCFIAFNVSWAQDGPMYLTVTQSHWDWDYEDGNPERWMELEKMWHDNVTMKNEYILGSGVYLHLYTGDNSEVLFVTLYSNWSDIMKAGPRNGELAAEAWPDDEERQAMNQERSAYYADKHADEIYMYIDELSKPIMEYPEEPLVFLAVDRHLAFPDDAVDGEMGELMKEFTENVTHKNPHIVGHFMHRHAWGSDGRDMLEVYAVKSMDDIDDMQKAQGELIEAHWPDEEERKEFFKKFNKYWTPWHSDRFYQNQPELMKVVAPPPPPVEVKEAVE